MGRSLKMLTNLVDNILDTSIVIVRYWRTPTKLQYVVGLTKSWSCRCEVTFVVIGVAINDASSIFARVRMYLVYLAWDKNKPPRKYRTSMPKKNLRFPRSFNAKLESSMIIRCWIIREFEPVTIMSSTHINKRWDSWRYVNKKGYALLHLKPSVSKVWESRSN